MTASPAVYEAYKADQPSKFLFFAPSTGLDGKKLGDVQQKVQVGRQELATTGVTDPQAALAKLTPDEKSVQDASIRGDRKTLVADSFIPATMALIYLIILLYFKAIGGYKPVHIVPVAEQQAAEARQAT
jgi:hypothetical protein